MGHDIQLSANKRRKRLSLSGNGTFLLSYTVAFIVVAFIAIAGYYVLYRKSFVWSDDGIKQHFLALSYFGSYLRQILNNIFVKHIFTIPTWSYDMGYGADILITLHYYVIGDPLNLLSVFFKGSSCEFLYSFLIFLRLYLAGLAFIYYSLSGKKKNDRYAVLLGAICYTFCGFALFAAVRHPYFINPMIYFPLIAAGIDKVFEGKRPYLFILSVALAGISNFYFFYMHCILMFIYAVFKYFAVYKKIVFKALFTLLGKFIIFFAAGAALAGGILLPEIRMTLSTNRFAVSNVVPYLYNTAYYWKLLAGFSNSSFSEYWLELGFNSLTIFAIAVLFVKRKKNLPYKLAVILFAVFGLFPYIGHLFNGTSYVSNRWCFAFAFLASYITVIMYPDMLTLSKKELAGAFAIGGAYFLCCTLCYQSRIENSYITLGLTAGIFIIVLMATFGVIKIRFFKSVLLIIVVLSIAVNGLYRFSPTEGNYIAEFEEMGKVYDKITDKSPTALIKAHDDGSFFRYDTSDSADEVPNTNLIEGLSSTEYYYSLANNYVSDFNNEMYLNTCYDNWYNNLNGRSMLEELACVKYYLTTNMDASVPYIFGDNMIDVCDIDPAYYGDYVDNITAALYENTDALPFGYTYSTYIPRSEYEKMSVTEKQQALMQGVVLDEDPGLAKTKTSFTDTESKFTVSADYSMNYTTGTLYATQSGKGITINYTVVPGCETYLIFDGLTYEDVSSSVLTAHSKKHTKTAPETVYEKLTSLRDDFFRTKKEYSSLSLLVNGTKSTLNLFTKSNSFYAGRDNFLMDLGYTPTDIGDTADADERTVKITFSNTGKYSFDDIRIVNQPMNDFSSQADAFKEETMKDVSIGDNRIAGDIDLSSDKFLLIPLAYSDGWTAVVDGKTVDLTRANTMYMGLMLRAGHHDITLEYHTPMLRTGVEAAGCGLGAFVAILVIYEITIKKRAKKDEVKSTAAEPEEK